MFMQSYDALNRCFCPTSEAWRLSWDADVILDSNAVSKRFTVTVPDSVFDELEAWAEYQGRPTANLATYLIEAGLRQAKLEGEFKILEQPSADTKVKDKAYQQSNGSPAPQKKKKPSPTGKGTKE